MDEENGSNWDYSRTALMAFIEYITKKALVTPNVGRNWRVASSRLLKDLSAHEEADVRAVNLEIAVRRALNRDPTALSPESLSTYRARVATAIEEFEKFQSDPSRYTGPQGKSRPKQASDRGVRQERKPVQNATSTSAKTPDMRSPTPVGGLTYDYPLRPDFLVSLAVPRDLTMDEARRLSKFLTAIAIDDDEE